MATQRYISTSFWTDKWIRGIDPSERYIYIYLLTNPETNIAGVYDVTIDRIAFDTGYDERTLRPILDRFSKAGKAHFINDEWVVIPAWPKHQRVKERDNNRKGIDAILKALPSSVFEQLEALGYEYRYLKEIERPSEAPSKPLARESNYSDSDSDLDLDTDTDLSMRADARAQGDDHHPPVPAEAKKPRPLAPLTDPVAAQWEQALTQMQPPDTWPNVAKERKHCQTLGQKTANLLGNSPYHEPADLIAAVLREYHRMKSKAKASDTYWRHAPFTPSAVLTRWADIWASMATRFEQDTRQARMQESLQEVVF